MTATARPFFLFIFLLPLNVYADEIWIDVRSVEEYQSGHIDGDINIPFRTIGDLIGRHVDSKDADIKLYCVAGVRSGIAKIILERKGYTNVTNVISVGKARRLRNSARQ